MRNKALWPVPVLIAAVLAFLAPSWGANDGRYFTTPELLSNQEFGTVTKWAPVQTEAAVTTDTVQTYDLSDSGNRPYPSMGFTIYNRGTVAAEWAVGGATWTTCTGVSPVTEVVASDTYVVHVADVTKFRTGSSGTLFEIYDASAANAVLLRAVATGRADASGNPITTGDGYITCKYISGTTPTNAAASDPVGGPNRYTFTTGDGHVVWGNSSSGIIHVEGQAYRYIHLKRVGGSGTANIRIVQSQ